MRLQTIDVMRGVASLLVAMFHMGMLGVGWVGVPVFFVISGFIIPYAMYRGGYTLSAWPRYMTKRILRIEPPYLAAVLMALLLAYFSSIAPGYQGKGFNTTPTDVVLHVGYLVEFLGHEWLNPVFWTLSIELQYYIFISLCFGLLMSDNRYYRLFFMLSCYLLGFVFSDQRPVLFPWLGLFCIGIAAFQYRIKHIKLPEMLLYFLLSSLVLMVVSPEDGTFMKGSITVTAVISGLVIAFVSYRGNRFLLFLGTISYSLYLVHIPIGGRVINLGKRFISESLIEQFMLSFVALSVSIVFAWVFYHLFEKPATKWASRMNYGREKKIINKVAVEENS